MLLKSNNGPKFVTANNLLDGGVIYLGANDRWVRHFEQAAVFETADASDQALERATAQSNIAVGPYLAEAVSQDGVISPFHFREDFRRDGPSNYSHGKQEEPQQLWA